LHKVPRYCVVYIDLVGSGVGVGVVVGVGVGFSVGVGVAVGASVGVAVGVAVGAGGREYILSGFQKKAVALLGVRIAV